MSASPYRDSASTSYSLCVEHRDAQTPPALVRLSVWGVSGAGIARAFTRMATDRLLLRRVPGLMFWKLMGTGSGRTFTTRDADPRHWALLTTWSEHRFADEFAQSRPMTSWADMANEQLTVDMTPLISRGVWSGQTPFGDPHPHRYDGPVAAITRARIKTSMWRQFWKNVPPVSEDLHNDPGLLFSMGIGEAPVGLQGTFSLWRDNLAISEFAQRRNPHRVVIERTHALDWYAEELFARFAVTRVSGTYDGADIGSRLPSNQ